MKNVILQILFFLFALPVLSVSQNIKEKLPNVKFEHLRVNVLDKEATAKWYVENVGLEIIPSSNDQYIYVADKDHNFKLELSSIAGIKNTYNDIPVDGFHLAFEGHKSIQHVAEKMITNGGVQEGELYTNKIGDYVMNVRDINGFNAQLIHRVDPFFSKPVKSSIRFEHFAFNTPDQKTAALWYIEFMDLKMPWSKDIDKNNLERNYRVPYVGDVENNMSLELFGKDLKCFLSNLPHNVIHIAFSTDMPEEIAKRMILGGATQVGETKSIDGDVIIDLYDPNKIPLRLIKRKK